MNKTTITATALFFVLTLGPAAHARRGYGGGLDDPHRGSELLKVAQDAGLSDAQIKQIRKLTIASQRTAVELHAEAMKARLDLREMMEGDAMPDEEEVLALIDRIGKLKLAKHKNRARTMLKVRKMVTPAQWQKLVIAFGGHRGHGFGGGVGRGPCSCAGDGRQGGPGQGRGPR